MSFKHYAISRDRGNGNWNATVAVHVDVTARWLIHWCMYLNLYLIVGGQIYPEGRRPPKVCDPDENLHPGRSRWVRQTVRTKLQRANLSWNFILWTDKNTGTLSRWYHVSSRTKHVTEISPNPRRVHTRWQMCTRRDGCLGDGWLKLASVSINFSVSKLLCRWQ